MESVPGVLPSTFSLPTPVIPLEIVAFPLLEDQALVIPPPPGVAFVSTIVEPTQTFLVV